MSPQSSSNTNQAHGNPEQRMTASMAETIGRMDEKLTRLVNMEERVRVLETDQSRLDTRVTHLEVNKPQKAPWYSVVGGFTGAGSLVITLIILIQFLGEAPAM